MPSRSELVHTSATTIANNDDSNANQRVWNFCAAALILRPPITHPSEVLMTTGLKPLTDAEAREVELVFRLTKSHLGFVPNSMRTMARQPAILSSFTLMVGNILGQPSDAKSPIWLGIRLVIKNVIWSLRNMRSKDRLPLALKNLVAHVTSGAAGCRYCQAHTIGEARDQGVPIEKLEAVWEFDRSDLFDEAEKSALRFALAAGSHPNGVTADHFADLRKHYTEDQIVELGATIALFGFLNRWNDTFATTLEPESAAFANQHLSASGWEIGKHG